MSNIRHRAAKEASPVVQGLFIIGMVFLALTIASIATWMLAHGAGVR